VCERTDGHLTPAAQPVHDGAFGAQRHRRTRIVDGCDHFSRTRVALPNLDCDDALSRRRHAEFDGQECRDASAPLQSSKSSRGQHESIIVAGVQFPEARIQIAAHRQECRRRREVHELGDSPDAARTDSRRASERLPDSIDLLFRTLSGRQHDCVPWIFSRQHAGDLEPLREQCRHVFAAVNGEVHLAGEQRILDFLHEQALAADL